MKCLKLQVLADKIVLFINSQIAKIAVSGPFHRNLVDIIFEIRAFDTTNYLLFSQNRTLLEMVATRFNSQIKTKKEYEDEVGYISAKEEFKNSKKSRALL